MFLTLLLLLIPVMVVISMGTVTGFGQKKFLGKVHDLELDARRKEKDLLDCVHDRSAELSGEEKVLVVPRITVGALVSMPATDETFVNGSIEDTLEIPIDDEKGYPILVGEAEQLETNIALRNVRAKSGEISHREYRQKLILKSLADASEAENRVKLLDPTGNKVTQADFLRAATILDNAKAPITERYAFIGSSMHAELMEIPGFVSRDKMGDKGEALPSNVIGSLLGFEVIKKADGDMPLLHATTGATATTGKACIIFSQYYALAYCRHAYKMLGPNLNVRTAKTELNLYAKQGTKGQNTEFIVTIRKN